MEQLLLVRFRRGLAWALSVLLIYGCSAEDGAQGGPATEDPAPPPQSVGQTSVQIAPTSSSSHPTQLLSNQPADQAVLMYAESVLTSRCMAEQGFTYEALNYEDLRSTLTEAVTVVDRVEFPYDPDVEGIPYASSKEPTHADPNVAYIRSLSESARATYGEALQGSIQDRATVNVLGSVVSAPRGGCQSKARTQLYGTIEDAITSLMMSANLRPSAETIAREDAGVIAAMSSWSDCMRDSGFQFDNFGAARSSAQSAPTTSERVATADGRCTATSRLGEIYRHVYNQAMQTLIDNNFSQYEATAHAQSRAIQRANALVANEPGS